MTRGRPRGENTRCGGKWTEAEFRSFVKNQLRLATRKWAPIQQCKKRANVSRGLYRCDSCHKEVAPTVYDEEKRKRVHNIYVDHIKPIIDPEVGWVSWDSTIENMFCEPDNLQLLCRDCHKIKSQEEIDLAKARRIKENLNNE